MYGCNLVEQFLDIWLTGPWDFHIWQTLHPTQYNTKYWFSERKVGLWISPESPFTFQCTPYVLKYEIYLSYLHRLRMLVKLVTTIIYYQNTLITYLYPYLPLLLINISINLGDLGKMWGKFEVLENFDLPKQVLRLWTEGVNQIVTDYCSKSVNKFLWILSSSVSCLG